MSDELRPRVGTFFILVGLVLFFVFISSVLGKDFNVVYLLLSVAAMFLGFLFRRRAAPTEPSRFTTIRNMKQRARHRREQKKAKEEK